MATVRRKVVNLAEARHDRGALPSLPACVVGSLVAVDRDGQITVDFVGNPHGPVPARSVQGLGRRPELGAPVALIFEGGNARLPIVLGFPSNSTEQDLTLEVDRLLLNASRELTLRCGTGTITIRADGSIVVRGSTLLSRASGVNKIRGAAVRIN
jgi:hypothetical protein